MTGESQIYGYPDWRLPSPSSTPKAPNFTSPTLRTPKSADTPSYFVDAFSTPRPHGQTTPAHTPVYGTFTVVERPASPSSQRAPRPEDAAFHVNHPSSTPHLQLPPVSPARRLSSSPNLITSLSSSEQSASSGRSKGKGAMESYQMQTPPPTRDASSRRKMPPPSQPISGTPSAISMGTPMQSNQMHPPQPLGIQTPFQYNPLQFSPDTFQFPTGGPASAPVYPQSRLFWDPNSPSTTSGMTMAAGLNDPFGPSPQPDQDMPVWPAFNAPTGPPPPVFNPQQHPHQQIQSNPTFWSPGDVGPRSSSLSQALESASTTGINPSMLVSFASPTPLTSTIEPQQTQLPHSQDLRQPYEQQAQESRREQESVRKAKQQQQQQQQQQLRPTSSSSTAAPGGNKLGLQRSNTDSGFRRRQNQSTDSRLSTHSLEQTTQRKASPLKRHSQQGQASLTAIPEAVRVRPRTRLVIGEDGRARTETVSVEEGDDSDNRRRSGLWHEIDSDSPDSEAEDTVPSQRSSFVFSTDMLRRSSKHARLDSAADTAKVTRTSSTGSLSNLQMGIRRSASSSSRRSHTKVDPRRFSIASFGAGSGASEGGERNSWSWEMEGVEEGDAQVALKKVVEDRHKRQGVALSPEDILKAHNQRWSLSSDIAKLQPFTAEAGASTPSSFDPHQTISPSAVTDFAFHNITPSTDQLDFISPLTRRNTAFR